MNITAPCRTILAGVILLTVIGCDREPVVTQSSQPKEPAVAPAPPMAPAMGNGQLPPDHPPIPPGGQMPGMGQAQGKPAIAWTVPAGWKEDKTPRPMREATVLIGEGEKSAELVVTRLAGQFGEFGANINRWRGQIGLEPDAAGAQMASREVKSPAGSLQVYELEGPVKRMVVGILKQGDANWFFKMTGDKAAVIENQPAFDQFLGSLRTSE